MQKGNPIFIYHLIGVILVAIFLFHIGAEILKDDYRIDIKPFKQTDDSRCGEACIKMVLDYYGINTSEDSICVRTNHTYELGSDDEGIKRAIESYGLNCIIKNNATFDDIEYHISHGSPVIVDWMSDFEGYQRYGHSSVVVDLDSTYIYLLDPYIGEVKQIERVEFETVWFDWKYTQRITCENLVVAQIIVPSPKKWN